MIDADAFRSYERAGWEARAGAYTDLFTPVMERCVEPLLAAAGVGPGTRMLDVATGPGTVCGYAAAHGAAPVGLDFAAAMVDLAAARHPDVRFVQGDAEALPFESGEFDAAVCNFGLPHFPEPARAIAEMIRVVRPGGRVALVTHDLPERSALMGMLIRAAAAIGAGPPAGIPPGPPPMAYGDEVLFAALLSDAGLADVSVTTISFPYATTVADLWHALQQGTVRSAALIEGQDPATRARLWQEFERLADEFSDGSGILIPVSAKLGSGTRPA